VWKVRAWERERREGKPVHRLICPQVDMSTGISTCGYMCFAQYDRYMCFAQYDTDLAFLRENERERESKQASKGEMSLGGTTRLLHSLIMR